MRILAIVIVGGALLAYGLTRPAPTPAPPAKTALAALRPTALAKPVQASLSAPLPNTVMLPMSQT